MSSACAGGHIIPVWMRLDAEGLAIVEVRDERAAVYIAHAYGELTGHIGVARVTAGLGITNAMTALANAHVAQAPVLVLSGTPLWPQENRGALQDILHTDLVRSITCYARAVRERALFAQELDEAIAWAEGHGGDPGPVDLSVWTDTLRAAVPAAVQLPEHFAATPKALLAPDDAAAAQAAEVLWNAKRPPEVSVRGARAASDELIALLDVLVTGHATSSDGRSGVAWVPDLQPLAAWDDAERRSRAGAA